jgi:hypothetical protein
VIVPLHGALSAARARPEDDDSEDNNKNDDNDDDNDSDDDNNNNAMDDDVDGTDLAGGTAKRVRRRLVQQLDEALRGYDAWIARPSGEKRFEMNRLLLAVVTNG